MAHLHFLVLTGPRTSWTSDVCRISDGSFVTLDDRTGAICAGCRQSSSTKGVAGSNAWDGPLEIRCCRPDDTNLTTF